ncbi:MAG: YkgJ family cysteine cluster protein [Myxococcota bacterium]
MSNPDASRPSGWETEALNRRSVENESDAGASHPCVSCGACCAYFRASFYFGECQAHGIPEDLVEQISPFLVAMKGTTSRKNTRCIALNGTVGQFGTTCQIYDNRSSTCRDFVPSYEDGLSHTPECDRARRAHGLKPLRPEDWAVYRFEQSQSLLEND